MIRNLLPWTAGCLLAAFAVSSCESDDVDYGPISAAIEIGVEEVTPSSAKIRLTTEQENVASYKIVKPTPISEFEYAAHDAIDRLAFIEERGEAAGAPFEQTLAGLMPKVEYSFAVVGLDASGQRITAPTFARFTTAYASSLVEARFETNPDETFTFTGKITPNAYTVSYRYIFDSDHNEATEAELRALLEAGGSGVKTDKGVKELELVKSDKAGVTLAVLSYDDANRPGEFTSTFVSTEDMASVIVDGKETQLARPTEGVDIFEGKAAVPAKSGFTVEINKVAYGFAPYSGNGGVGKVENMMSAAPYYSSSTIADSRGYDCKMAVGRMAATADGGNDFWTNLSEDAHILVRVDLTYADGTPRYVLDALMNKRTYLEVRFDAVRYTAVLTGNEYADLTQAGGKLAAGTTKLEGHKEFSVSSGLWLVGHSVDLYLRDGEVIGAPAPSVQERVLTVFDHEKLERICAGNGVTLTPETRYYRNYSETDASVLDWLDAEDVVIVLDRNGNGWADAVLVLDCYADVAEKRPRRRIRIVFVFPQTPGIFVKFIFCAVGADDPVRPRENARF